MGVGDLFDMHGRVVLVSGAGRGIGAASAVALADVGADVAIMARSEDQLESVAARIRGLGRRALVLTCDANDVDLVSADARRHGLELVLATGHDGHIGADVGQCQGAGGPDAAACTGDDRMPALE